MNRLRAMGCRIGQGFYPVTPRARLTTSTPSSRHRSPSRTSSCTAPRAASCADERPARSCPPTSQVEGQYWLIAALIGSCLEIAVPTSPMAAVYSSSEAWGTSPEEATSGARMSLALVK